MTELKGNGLGFPVSPVLRPGETSGVEEKWSRGGVTLLRVRVLDLYVEGDMDTRSPHETCPSDVSRGATPVENPDESLRPTINPTRTGGRERPSGLEPEEQLKGKTRVNIETEGPLVSPRHEIVQ